MEGCEALYKYNEHYTYYYSPIQSPHEIIRFNSHSLADAPSVQLSSNRFDNCNYTQTHLFLYIYLVFAYRVPQKKVRGFVKIVVDQFFGFDILEY